MSDSEWTDEDTAAVYAESLPVAHPSQFVDIIRGGATTDPDGARLLLTVFVTPESLGNWGEGFEGLIRYMQGSFRMSTTALYGVGAPDVAYIRFVPDEGPWINPDLTKVDAIGHATLVWRGELEPAYHNVHWRLHALGEALPPEFVPRSPDPIDPRPLISSGT